jgi:hypothetical protein
VDKVQKADDITKVNQGALIDAKCGNMRASTQDAGHQSSVKKRRFLKVKNANVCSSVEDACDYDL